MTNLTRDIRLGHAMEQYGSSVLRMAFVYVKNHADAEDVAQDVFLAYYNADILFPNDAAEKAWLLKAAVNRSKNLLHSAWRRKTVALSEEISYLEAADSALLGAVLSLGERYKLPLHLFYYEGFSLKEVSELLHIKPSTVGSRLNRGRQKLKEILKEDYNGAFL